MRKWAEDVLSLSEQHVVMENNSVLKLRAVITKAGVYEYPDGMARKSARTLLDAVKAARYAKLHIGDHPDTMVIMSSLQVNGGIEKPFWDRDKMRAVLCFDKSMCTKEQIDKARAGDYKEVSIGFYYRPDRTAGVYPDVNTGKMVPYDYDMKDIMIDHVAVGVGRGRCNYPSCGVGVDAQMRSLRLFGLKMDIVGKKGNQWCVFHCHPDGTRGAVIKCFPTKEEADRMHRAIMARKNASQDYLGYGYVMNMSSEDYKRVFGDQDERPPKAWFDKCKSSTPAMKMADPGAFCGWLWYHGEEAGGRFTALRKSFGAGLRAQIIGGKENLSIEELFYPERTKEFNQCVATRVADGMPREQAEALCEAATKPSDEPTPPGGTLDCACQSPYQKFIIQKIADGKTLAEAMATAKKEKIMKTDQDAAFENCVTRKMEEGQTREEAEKACRKEHPLEAEAQEEPTPLEKCTATKQEEGMSEEEARTWCEAELAGEHEKGQDLIERNVELLKLKNDREIELRRQRARAT